MLFRCPSKPPDNLNELWLNTNCTLKGENNDTLDPAGSLKKGKTYHWTAPKLSQAGASGSGWWAACFSWRSFRTNGVDSPSIFIFNVSLTQLSA
jgi:hypothetical protein